jgi:hypothetical protein
MIALPKWVGALVLAAVVIVAPTRAAAQETTPVAANEPLRVFLDCRQPGCDGNFFIDEMPYVRFTRDRMDAEAYLLVTGLGTGAGGIQYTVNVTGQGPFVGRSDTLVSSVPPNSTADQRRRELLRIFRLGLVRYLTATSFASRLSLTYVAPTTSEPSPTAVTNDPWDAWIYRVSANGNFGGESQSRNSRFNGSLSARRITNDWKFTAGASSSYRASRYTFTDGTNTSYTLRTYSTAFRLVRSLTSHWSAGVASEAGSTDFANQKLFVRANLSAEYNFFPWADATSNQVVAIYSLGVQHYRYVEQTIYFLDQETRPSHQVVLAATTRQQWGSFDVQARMSQYLHDGSKQNMSVSGSTDLRLSRGFSLNLSAYASQVRDQLYLAAGTLSRDEVLTQQRALQTSYQYNFFLGLSYTFGSIYNSVVNPRLDYSGGIFF